MKKAVIIFALLTIGITPIFAQTDSGTTSMTDNRDKLMIGIKAGANYSNVYDSQGENFVADAKFGLAAGAFVAIPIGKFFGVQPEVQFSQKGFKSTGTLLGTPYSMTRTTNYIDVPLLVAVKPIDAITLLAGPQFSYLLKQKDDYTGGTTTASQIQEFNNDNLRKNTFCFVGGIDVNIENIVIGARAAWDLKDNNGDGTSTTPRYKNMWYQLTLGYRF